MPQRVLFLAEYGWRNGGENSFLAIAPLLIQKQFHFIAAVPTSTEFSAALTHLGCDIVDLQFHRQGERKSQPQIREELEALIRHIKPDLVHCNSLSTSRLAGPVTRSCDIPSLGYLRDILRLSGQAIRDISELNQLVAVSHATRDYHVAAGMPPERIQVIYNGVDLVQFSPRPASGEWQQSLGIPPASEILICVGQIGLRKAVDVVLKSFCLLAANNPSLHMVFAGCRHSKKQEAIDYELELKKTSAASCFSDRIHWVGRIEDISGLMNDSTLLLHAARQEPLGRVLLEAAASGLPFVATDVGGTPEIVRNQKLPMIPLDAPQAMNEAAQGLLSNPEQRHQFSASLRRLAESQFSNQRCTDELSQVYSQLLNL